MPKNKAMQHVQNAMEADEVNNMLIEVDWKASGIFLHEKELLLEGNAEMLLPVTLAAIEDETTGRSERLVYSSEGMISIASFDPDRNTTLSDLFRILESYIYNLKAARDLLLDERLMSSDPGRGVFMRDHKVKSVWGEGPREDFCEKICRVASCLATKDRVMGAVSAMEQIRNTLATGTHSLGECLKIVEIGQREWNYII